ncbi:MAG: hypothetical protein KKE73_07160 [Proteobacteria bacterium]|nr:hypothetical protein [Pseudomonadota bacterium]
MNIQDIKATTEEGLRFPPQRCRERFIDADCGLLEGPSVYYSKTTPLEAL